MRTLLLLLALAGPALADDFPSASGDGLPNPDLTPGLADPALTKEVLCARGFTTRSVRHVTAAMHHQIFAAYGIPWSEHRKYEDDHLIPLTIGGSNSNQNRWPQPLTGPWNAHVKDHLEDKMRPLICAGKLDLDHARRAIAEDWIAFYHLVFGERAATQPR